MSKLPVKGPKQTIAQNKVQTPQKYNPQPIQHKVQNQVGFYASEQNNVPAARNVSPSSAVAEYKDLNEKKTGFAVHGLYALLVLLVGTAAYVYAMKVKPPKVEVVEKIVEKTVERVEYVAPPAETASYTKIEVDINVPRIEKKPEKNRFEQDFKVEEVRRKYEKIRSDLYQEQSAERKAYISIHRGGYMDWAYSQIDHKYDDLKSRLEEKEKNEICSVTDDAFWCDQAAKFSIALKNKRLPAAETYPTYRSSNSTTIENSQTPIYPSKPSSPADNGIDSVGKDIEEI